MKNEKIFKEVPGIYSTPITIVYCGLFKKHLGKPDVLCRYRHMECELCPIYENLKAAQRNELTNILNLGR